MWVYPSNLEPRQYQFNIARKCLTQNCMVCIPTGMGKTFIAAVVMYNYFRWYSEGIIVFAAPTRALVDQQIKACYDYLDINQNEYMDLTGKITPRARKRLWTQHRIFFVSPQTLQSDINRSHVPVNVRGAFVRCVSCVCACAHVFSLTSFAFCLGS